MSWAYRWGMARAYKTHQDQKSRTKSQKSLSIWIGPFAVWLNINQKAQEFLALAYSFILHFLPHKVLQSIE